MCSGRLLNNLFSQEGGFSIWQAPGFGLVRVVTLVVVTSLIFRMTLSGDSLSPAWLAESNGLLSGWIEIKGMFLDRQNIFWIGR